MSIKYGRAGADLLRELQRGDWLPPYNTAVVRKSLEECRQLNDQILSVVEASNKVGADKLVVDKTVMCSLVIQNQSILRNKRCLLAYVNYRMDVVKNLRWHTGSTVPAELKPLLDGHELNFFTNYDKNVTKYMDAIGLDLTEDMEPPRELKIEVRVLQDCGEILTETGPINLTKNSTHFVRRADVQHLIRQNMLRQIQTER
jgi:GINS complex subunit 1